jgi:hypothetical protein
MLTGSILLRQGSQLSKPVNLDNQRSFRTMLTYSLPVRIVGALAHFNIGYTNTTTPSLINNQYNRSNSVTISPGLSLNSNISEDFDYMAMYGANFNTVKNSSQTGYQYFYHTASGRIQWTFWEGFYIRTDARHQLNRNRTTNLEQKYTVWNAGFGKKLFANDRGEISFQVFDLLNENKNVVQTAEDTYLEEQRTNNLTQYYLLTFSYRLSSIGEMFRENPPPPPPPM